MKVYEASDYRDYIRFQMAANGGIRGYQKKLAEVAQCQSSFLSQVLHTHVQLTPDQAASMCAFWKLDEDETEYFLGLVHLARAGTPTLARIIKRRLDELKQKNRDLAQRFKKRQKLDLEQEIAYYTAWYYSAIHMLTTIPRYRTTAAIAEKLHLPPNLVIIVLQNLVAMKLVRQEGMQWRATDISIHLPKQSKLSTVNHANWRQYVLRHLQENHSQDLHYTAIHTLSCQDIDRFKNLIMQCIESTRALVDQSPEEEMVCFSCDLFVVS